MANKPHYSKEPYYVYVNGGGGGSNMRFISGEGAPGADGFPTEAMWNDLVARVTALENQEP